MAAVASPVKAVKARNNQELYVYDPIIDDKGGMYVARALVQGLYDQLLSLADITTLGYCELERLTRHYTSTTCTRLWMQPLPHRR